MSFEDRAPRNTLRVRPRHVVRWVAVIVVALLIASVVYAVYNYVHFTNGVTKIDAIPAATSTASGTSSSSSGENILLVGDDHRPDGASAAELALLGTTADGGSTNTDTMMILHIPSNGAKSSLISLPRDSWVAIPGNGMNKLNAAFAFGSASGGDAGGAQLLVTTVQNLTGMHIDHFIRISLLGFYDVAKALGPIQVCLVSAVNDPYSTFVAPAGVSTLDASQALAFVRQRHGLPLGDLDREIRQRYFLTAEAKNLLSASTLLNPVKLSNALGAVSSAIQTDSGLNFLSLVGQLRNLTGGTLNSVTIPTSGTPTIYSGGSAVSIVKVDTAAMPAFVASLDDTTSSASASASASAGSGGSGSAAVTPGDVTVTVLNGSGVNGAAGTNTSTLDKAGFSTTTPTTVTTRPATTIQYPASMATQAALLATYVPGATLEAVTGVNGVTLVLGTDGVSVKSSATPSGSGNSSGSSSSGGTSTATTSAAASKIPCLN